MKEDITHFVKAWVECQVNRTTMVRNAKLNLVSMDQLETDQMMVVVQLEQILETHREARKFKTFPYHICGVLVRYKNAFTNELFQKLLPNREKRLCSTKY